MGGGPVAGWFSTGAVSDSALFVEFGSVARNTIGGVSTRLGGQLKSLTKLESDSS